MHVQKAEQDLEQTIAATRSRLQAATAAWRALRQHRHRLLLDSPATSTRPQPPSTDAGPAGPPEAPAQGQHAPQEADHLTAMHAVVLGPVAHALDATEAAARANTVALRRIPG